MTGVETISTSTRKYTLLSVLLFLLVGSVSAQFYYNDELEDFSDNGDFSASFSYDSQKEIATELVAPFLLITVIFQIGFNKVLLFTFDVNNNNHNILYDNDKKERKQARKYSVVMALMVAGMITGSPFFGMLKSYISYIFGSVIFLLGFAIVFAIIYFFYKVVT